MDADCCLTSMPCSCPVFWLSCVLVDAFFSYTSLFLGRLYSFGKCCITLSWAEKNLHKWRACHKTFTSIINKWVPWVLWSFLCEHPPSCNIFTSSWNQTYILLFGNPIDCQVVLSFWSIDKKYSYYRFSSECPSSFLTPGYVLTKLAHMEIERQWKRAFVLSHFF